MPIFIETQGLNKWWLYAIALFTFGLFFVAFYSDTKGFIFSQQPFKVAATFLCASVPIVILMVVKLKTKITDAGINATFSPFNFTRRFYKWKEIESVYVRKYSALTEYGGWGLQEKPTPFRALMASKLLPKQESSFLLELKSPKKQPLCLTEFRINKKNKMKKYLSIILIALTVQFSLAQEKPYSEKEVPVNKFIDGTLSVPDSIPHPPLVIFIQGSGPVDRNGNARMAKNDGIKKIAHQLAENGIASYRFDKRIFKMDKFNIKEEDLRFNDFVVDVDSVLVYFKNQKNFSKIILAGHSEGSLIGILAAPNGADALISLAGAGRPIDSIIVEQLAKQSPELSQNARTALDEIKEKGSTSNYNPLLQSIFRPSVQPFIASWMQYEPSAEIAKLNIPILIINGTKDIQVDVEDAKLLHTASPNSKLVIIDGMNHIFRNVEGNDLENVKTYSQPEMPLHPELISTMVDFIKSLQ